MQLQEHMVVAVGEVARFVCLTTAETMLSHVMIEQVSRNLLEIINTQLQPVSHRIAP